MDSEKNFKKPFSVILTFLLLFACRSIVTAQTVFQDVPSKIDATGKYLFFFHGQIVEDKGIRPTSEKYGVYEYKKILDAFRNRGFFVISEARKKNTDIWTYAKKITEQINKLLEAGVCPQNITIVGASKGGAITILISSFLKNKDINYVIIAACTERIIETSINKGIYLWGNVLSIYNGKDEYFGSCQKFFDESKGKGLNKYKEIKLDIRGGHGFHYKPLKEWIDPIVNWINKQ